MTIKTVLPDTYGEGLTSILEKTSDGIPNLRIRFKFNLWPRDPFSKDLGNSTPNYHIATAQSPVRYGRVLDGNKRSFEIRSLTTAEFNSAKIRLKRFVELVFNKQIVLLPPDDTFAATGAGAFKAWGLNDEDYKFFISDPSKPAHCIGSLDIVLADLNDFKGPVIEIVQVRNRHETRFFRAFDTRINMGNLFFQRRVYPQFENEVIFDLAAAHEIGHHVIGFHINFQGVDDPDSDAAYGITVHDRRAIMGAGNVVTSYDARPWIERAMQHTGTHRGWRFLPRAQFDRGGIPISEQQRRIVR
jgi:hypothetical protein